MNVTIIVFIGVVLGILGFLLFKMVIQPNWLKNKQDPVTQTSIRHNKPIIDLGDGTFGEVMGVEPQGNDYFKVYLTNGEREFFKIMKNDEIRPKLNMQVLCSGQGSPVWESTTKSFKKEETTEINELRRKLKETERELLEKQGKLKYRQDQEDRIVKDKVEQVRKLKEAEWKAPRTFQSKG
jgi:hypothetical protein